MIVDVTNEYAEEVKNKLNYYATKGEIKTFT